MGIEVTYTGHLRGVHPESFEDKLQELESTIRSIREQVIAMTLTDASRYVKEFADLWEELEDAVSLRAYIWQAQDADDVDVSF